MQQYLSCLGTGTLPSILLSHDYSLIMERQYLTVGCCCCRCCCCCALLAQEADPAVPLCVFYMPISLPEVEQHWGDTNPEAYDAYYMVGEGAQV